jgi:hypothetical protein
MRRQSSLLAEYVSVDCQHSMSDLQNRLVSQLLEIAGGCGGVRRIETASLPSATEFNDRDFACSVFRFQDA